MARLTAEQKQFLKRHGIPESKVFDGTGLGQTKRKKLMSVAGAIVCIGVSPCSYGHRLRLAAGHCAQCNTHGLAFQQRYRTPGEVYVAHSKGVQLTKIGTASDAESRLEQLNYYAYGGSSSWRLHTAYSCDKAGRVEHRAHLLLEKFRTSRSYVRDGAEVMCQELFKVSPAKAAKAIAKAIEAEDE